MSRQSGIAIFSLGDVTRIPSSGNFHAVSDTEVWQELANDGLVKASILTEIEDKASTFLPDEPLPGVEGCVMHEAVNAVSLSDVSFLRGRQAAILERVQRSRPCARLFWRFLTEWLMVHDARALSKLVTACECRIAVIVRNGQSA